MDDTASLNTTASPEGGEGLGAELYTLMAILAIFSIMGTFGNALVLYVFTIQKQKLTSTVFILALASMDFVTCFVIIPYTIVMEYFIFEIGNDVMCKLYHGLIATSVPFSTFIMVAIAVDRYLCICHPFMHAMTITRARIIVAVLALSALAMGFMASLYYGVYVKVNINNSTFNASTDLGLFDSDFATINNSNMKYNLNRDDSYKNSSVTVAPSVTEQFYYSNEGVCDNNYFVMSKTSLSIYQKIYSSLFLIAIIIVAVLYALIYKSVLARRKQRLKIVTNKCCLMWKEPSTTTTDVVGDTTEETEIAEKYAVNGSEKKKKSKESRSSEKNAEKDAMLKTSCRAKLEKIRMANLKTAAMLFVVTVVFVVTFLPAWLMAHKVLDLNLVVFYMYFTYNVANPIIYAFMNPNFRTQLREIFKCKS